MAYKLLETCGCDTTASIYSLLPALDREPPHFHRVYGHIIAKFPSMLDAAIHILSDPSGAVNEDSYEYKRIGEERSHFENLVQGASEVIGDNSILKPSSDKLSGAVALLSHVYFDSYNNPVQVFLPNSTFCSGQWDFWKNIGYMKFREKFYKKEVISTFREKLSNDELWKTKMDPHTLIKAMIIRLGDLSLPGVEYETVDMSIRDYLRYLDCNEYYRPDKELKFCKDLESRITSLIYESIE